MDPAIRKLQVTKMVAESILEQFGFSDFGLHM